jgi:hypothetical protein
VATFDDRPLRLDAGGAVVLLTRTPDRDWTERLPGGIEAQVASGSKGVRIEGLDTSGGLDELPALARDCANRALDLMAVRSAGSYALADQAMPLICWTSGPRPTIRITREAHQTFAFSLALAVAPGALAGQPSTEWHDSMRYFRMSQTTTDLFDAFRNLYLALESVLSTITPVQIRPNGRPEGEGAWTKRALVETARLLQSADSALTFDRYLRRPTTGDGTDLVFADLYQAARTSVFHAKNGRDFALPQNQRNRQQIAGALARYALLYTDLAEHVLGVRFGRSSLGKAGFDAIADSILNGMELGLSAEAHAEGCEFTDEDAAALLPLRTTRSLSDDQPMRATVLGTRPVSEFPADLVVRSIGARDAAGRLAMSDDLGGPLTLKDAESVEFLFSYRAAGQGIKTMYDT